MYNNPKINNINKNIDEIANRLEFNTNNSDTFAQLNREISNIDTKLENIVQQNRNFSVITDIEVQYLLEKVCSVSLQYKRTLYSYFDGEGTKNNDSLYMVMHRKS